MIDYSNWSCSIKSSWNSLTMMMISITSLLGKHSSISRSPRTYVKTYTYVVLYKYSLHVERCSSSTSKSWVTFVIPSTVNYPMIMNSSNMFDTYSWNSNYFDQIHIKVKWIPSSIDCWLLCSRHSMIEHYHDSQIHMTVLPSSGFYTFY